MPILARLVLVLAMLLAPTPWQAELQAQDSLSIGWAELDTTGLDADMSRLGVLLPKALMKATSYITERAVSPGEAVAGAVKVLNLDLEKAKNAVSAARRKRDLVSISTRDPARRALEIRNAQATLDKSIAALDGLLLKQDDILDTGLSPAVPLKLWKGHEEGILLPPVEVSAIVCAENKLDILVYGKIASLGPYLAIDLVLYVAATDEEVWKAAEYTAFDDLDGLVASLERPLATALAGRVFGRAIFTISPENAEILVDGKAHPANGVIFYSQDSYVATVSAAGFRPVTSRFAIVPGKDTRIDLQLVPVLAAPVFVESLPSGAALYIDGMPYGATPLELAGASYPRVLTARMEGFDDLKVILRPGLESGRLLLDLPVADGLAFSDRFEQAKGAFYQSLGWFILSLPVTVLSYGTFNSYLSLASLPVSVSEQRLNSLTMYYYGSQAVFWISAAISASLATNAIVRLVRYIKAAR